MILLKKFNPFTTHDIKSQQRDGYVYVWNNKEMGCVMSSEFNLTKAVSKFNSWMKCSALKRRLLKSNIFYGYIKKGKV